ncbi:uncharacterized protein N7473_012725 [Penicillium subrubescens]|uniref:uncharacterized protein n=1 Tax=Penicillium subrubescens TaxID=1316194 RepID=UPI002544E322|nr:uncharacterized protein N7473_012725 [Penicillium subrubescens]KAJ5875378.1 hypothetical protein N7473_012725 [Penicillium subrubescens]
MEVLSTGENVMGDLNVMMDIKLSRTSSMRSDARQEGTEMGALSGKQTAKEHEYGSQILAGDNWAPTSGAEKTSSVAATYN